MIPLALVLALIEGRAPAEPSYRRDIQPLLNAHCLICHAEKFRADPDTSGGVVLDTLPKLLNEKAGRLVRPGKSKESLLLQVLLRKDEAKRMPKDGESLTAEEIDLIRRWIDAGTPEGRAEAKDPAQKSKARARRAQTLALPCPQLQRPGTLRAGAGGPFSFQLSAPRLEPVPAVALSADGAWLVSGRVGSVAVWDLQEGRLRELLSVPGHVHDLRFSPKGDLLAAAGGMPGEAGWVRLYRLPGLEPAGQLLGHADSVTCVSFHPSLPQIATASLDKSLRVWSLPDGKMIREFLGHSDGVTAAAFSPDGASLFSASKDRTVRRFTVATGKAELTLSGHRDEALALTVAGNLALSGGAERGLSFWNAQTGERIRVQAGGGAAASLSVNHAGSLAASTGPEGGVQLWNLPAGSLARSLPLPGPQMAVALSADGAKAAVGGADGLVRLLDVRAGRTLGVFCLLPGGEWLIHTPEGWYAASEGLAAEGRLGALALPAEEVKEKLHRPEQVRQSLAGQPAAAPQPKRGERKG